MAEVKQRATIIIMITIIINKASLFLKSVKYNFEPLWVCLEKTLKKLP